MIHRASLARPHRPFLAWWLGALVFAAPTAGAEPLCRATARVEPGSRDRAAVVGQALAFSLEIDQRRDVSRARFQPALSFPSFRAEWLPTENLPDPDEGRRAYRERRVLIAGHAGRLRIPDIGLLCETTGARELVRVPGFGVDVQSPPEQGRPADWKGLIGPVELTRRVTAPQVQLGESLRVLVRVSGSGNVWVADPALEDSLPAHAADVFVLPSETQRDAGRELRFHHHLAYDVVPREEGSLALPEIRMAFYDPATRSYSHAQVAELVVPVAGRAKPAADEILPAEPPKRSSARPSGDAPGSGVGVGAALLGVLGAGLVGLGLWWRRRSDWAPDRPTRIRELLREADEALANDEIDRAGALLGSAARAGLAGAAPADADAALRAAAEELLTRVDDNPAARPWAILLHRLERLRFSGSPDLAELRAALAEASALARGESE
ncbi:MAG: hypothetical protein QF410_15320 [Planctomycetota bacterium]|nr:hypothetical protein [Planctomycetota bacterium]